MFKILQNYLVRTYLLFKGAYIYHSFSDEKIDTLEESEVTLTNGETISFLLHYENRRTLVYRYGFFREIWTKHYIVRAIFPENSPENLRRFNSLRFSTGYSILSFFPEERIMTSLMNIFLDYMLKESKNIT